MKSGSSHFDPATAVLAVCALVLTGLTISDRIRASPSPTAPVIVPDWREHVSEGRRYGSDSASITILVFGDYQCPACRSFQSTLNSVLVGENDISVVYRHWPLPGHRYAYAAARASECAGEQGKFLEYHNLLYEQQAFHENVWAELAAKAGVADQTRFDSCANSSAPMPRIERDIAAAQAIGGVGTPTILVNEQLLRMLPDSAALAQIAASALMRSGR